MITCDYCQSEIDRSGNDSRQVALTVEQDGQVQRNVHVDLHQVCVRPWAQGIKSIHGAKPAQ